MENLNVHYATASGIVVRSSGAIKNLVINASVIAATLKVYDGENSTGQVLLDIALPIVDTRQFPFDMGLPFYRGLYVEINANVASYSIVYTIG